MLASFLVGAVVLAGEPAIAVVRPRLVGGDNPALVEDVARLVAEGVDAAAVRRLAAAEVERVAGGCEAADCVRRLRGALAADLVLRATLTQAGRDFSLRLELIEGASGTVVARSEEGCDLCGRSELQAQVARQVTRLVPALRAAATAPPRLQVVTDPPGAWVYVDERLVGVTPFDEAVLAGEHSLRVTYPRHSPASTTFSARPDAVARARFELRRSPATMRRRGAGWGLLATGAALLAGGALLLAVDGRCSNAVRDASGQCPRLFDTDWGGAALGMSGAALATAGTVVLVRTRKRTGRVHALSVGPRGLGVVWRF